MKDIKDYYKLTCDLWRIFRQRSSERPVNIEAALTDYDKIKATYSGLCNPDYIENRMILDLRELERLERQQRAVTN